MDVGRGQREMEQAVSKRREWFWRLAALVLAVVSRKGKE